MLYPKKMRRFVKILFFSISFISIKAQSQQDTIYYKLDWKETVKDSAAFFRPPVKKEGELFRIEDYYASGQLQMSGLSKSRDKSVWQGEVSWYNEDGKLYQQGQYENNKLNGKFITFLADKKLVAIYESNYFISGEMNRGQNANNYYTEIKNDTIKEIIYGEDINGIRYENYRKVKGANILSKYYDEKGELIGTKKELDNGYFEGVEVFYYYNPMRVRQIRYYPYDRFLGETVYYPNGQLRTKFDMEPEYKKTFYALNGTELASVTYELSNNYLKPYDGTEIFFSYSYKEEDADDITSMRTYENGELTKEEIHYNKGALKTITTYKENAKQLQISYNEKGEKIARMTYQNYYPFNGTEITGNKEATYTDGELVKEINYYPKTKIIFNEKTQEKEIYYDKKGEVLGVLDINYQNKYAKPISGKRFYTGYNTDISSIESYEDGNMKSRTAIYGKLMRKDSIVEFKKTEYYEDNGYNKIREIVYYSNGSIQSDIEYKGYDKISGKFYNKKEELIGIYDYAKKDGTLYEFFPESNIVSLIKTEKEGIITSLKRYDYGPYKQYGDIDRILKEEIDVTCCSKSYTRNGDIFAEASYKNGQPWEGTVYDSKTKTLYTIKDGKRNGLYQVYDYSQERISEEGQFINDKREGLVKKYSYNGKLDSIEKFKNDILNGEATYYGEDEKPIASLVYKEGNPFDGTKIKASGYNKKPTEETYNNGVLTQRISHDESGKRITQFKDGKEAQTIAFHKDSDNKRLSYTVHNYYIDGEVIRYDKSGKVQNKAMFKNNKLESGVVFITSRDTYDKRVAYVILKKENGKLSVTMVDHNDKIVFFAEEDLERGSSVKYINKLNLYIDNLTPESLF
ncbi:toxin-antitoxin system YwqK family antitoxin [Winogradskyella sp. R77965]|uniref:toxin-antitoxin system YwqK family antitoxin n=1 Tax=Winogradskyella sp. R77965 TaxID=3093872 RepID=UPI0037DDD708